MAQKDKVKELVGRGLGSYHTKALQQMDRIEKKNKEQNHKISILTNELDNDYLTKTEEGSVISLEHSKEGMVYLDELQGNTLVNYCTNGSEELTLNNEINVQGTNITLTDTVDNGKVDVVCEGNTLVNEIKFKYKQETGSPPHIIFKHARGLKPNTTYTAITPYFDNSSINLYIGYNGYMALVTYQKNNIVKFTTGDTIPTDEIWFYYDGTDCNSIVSNLPTTHLILEGDYTNKPIPSYFEGMKSSFELEDNKVEVLSYKDYITGTLVPYHAQAKPIFYFSFESIISSEFELYRKYFNNCGSFDNCNNLFDYYSVNEGYWVNLGVWGITYSDCEKARTVINKYIAECEGNKNEIQLSEPLRGLPNGVCDKFVKQGDKWYVERNCGEYLYNGSENWIKPTAQPTDYTRFIIVSHPIDVAQKAIEVVSDKYLNQQMFNENSEGIFMDKNINLSISNSKLPNKTLDEFKEYLTKNPFKMVYELATPIYEEITDPQLITYLDTTHISTNSTIPCNMQIKNSGYNAIIKPSTQYTVAFDTNKSGEVNVGLGGAKTSTTNGVATITTPSTLTDDTLTLCGKGIKASNIRLLEGDKTNYIPQYFEGMKSCFEDKLQDDGSYKMEILSNNKNLFRYDSIVKRTSQSEVEYGENYVTITDEYYCGNIVKVKPFTDYYIRADREKYDENSSGNIAIYVSDGKSVGGTIPITSFSLNNGVFNTKNNNYISVLLYGGHKNRGKTKFSNILLTEFTSETEYIENKQNKIQFSSIEPLRAVGDVKDRLVLKDGKLMIERSCGKGVLGGEISRYHCWNNNPADVVCGYLYYYDHIPPLNNVKTHSNVKNNLLPSNQGGHISKVEGFRNTAYLAFSIHKSKLGISDVNAGLPNEPIIRQYFNDNPLEFIYQLEEPTYEEVPYEIQKIILEGYENGTLFFDTNIPPTSTVTYAGETPIVKSVRLNKTEVLNNTNDINDNIVPYLMDMDYRVVCLQLEGGIENISMARLFGGTYEMLQRDIQSKRYSADEYRHRLDIYLSANKITEDEYEKLGGNVI